MAKVELVMPKMGESIMEATILKWAKNVGETIQADETILEVATDKVDSEIPSPVSGTILEIRFAQDAVVAIGKVIAIIETESSSSPVISPKEEQAKPEPTMAHQAPTAAHVSSVSVEKNVTAPSREKSDRFYSPLVKNIAKEENISSAELDQINGSGADGRLTKADLLDYVLNKKTSSPTGPKATQFSSTTITTGPPDYIPTVPIRDGQVEIIEMDRMRRLIADHMVMSKQTSPHVTSFVETDVTNIVKWREKNKDLYLKKYGEKITFTPIFMEAVVRAIKDFPNINVSVDGTKIILKKNINIGMAAALPSGNLIVPVIKNADYLNLAGLTQAVNDLANRARTNKLKPEEVQDGTFTMTNVGTFGNLMGTPIINQPQVAILAVGAIVKKPAVVETAYGDLIAIRHLMFMSLAYDHRVVDGFLGGSFLKRISDYLEGFEQNREI